MEQHEEPTAPQPKDHDQELLRRVHEQNQRSEEERRLSQDQRERQ